jgi:LysR family transcriptional regulator, benzoate and cis,cis-muconate-responsive activator of ben and cat genes
MELRHLRYFVAVAEELSFSRAAERLHVSQPPLSRQVRDLESELHVQLFNRDRQKVKLTKAGQFFFARARRFVNEADNLRTVASSLALDHQRKLEIGYAPSPTVGIIGGILRCYHEMNSGSPATLHDLSLSQILAGLKGDKLDAGLTLRPKPREMRSFKFQMLRRYTVGIIISVTSPLAKLPSIYPSKIPINRLVGYREDEFPEYHQWAAKVLGIRKSRVRMRHECDGVISLIAAVEGSDSCAVVGEFTGILAGERVRYVPFASPAHFMDVGLLTRRKETSESVQRLSAAATLFCQQVADVVPKSSM